MEKLIHTIPPVYDENSRILILGSFPSVKSRESEFFYGHRQNRFWPLLARLTNCEIPVTVEEKKALLIKNHIALWDVAASCEITASSDSSIRCVVANDITPILQKANIAAIFTNGNKSAELYKRHIEPQVNIKAVTLPSTSPANARMNLDTLFNVWNTAISAVLN
ncbi:MAG: DNA-deoxyinosine glycosylase [Clostridia bacterium]|nr:DNA-deoxyinosine glycosylase [Clostridia bacterium]